MQETDREQIEMLKNFWREYGRWILLSVIVGLGLGYGWRGWQSHQADLSVRASQTYQEVLVLQSQNKDVTEQAKKVNQLKHQFSHTPYAALSAMALATQFVNQEHYDLAQGELHWVISQGANADLRNIARIQLARVQAQQTQWQQALTTLQPLDKTPYEALAFETRGDIYSMEHQAALAHEAYKKAFDAYQKEEFRIPC